MQFLRNAHFNCDFAYISIGGLSVLCRNRASAGGSGDSNSIQYEIYSLTAKEGVASVGMYSHMPFSDTFMTLQYSPWMWGSTIVSLTGSRIAFGHFCKIS